LPKTQIRDAATVIVIRDAATQPRVLMGQRAAGAAFMPSKFVFPGGAVDPDDAMVPLAAPLAATCTKRIVMPDRPDLAQALSAAAIRELWEESGLLLARPGVWSGEPASDWRSFAATGHVPDASGLSFVFRAITPPGRPRRFDARFFLAAAESLAGDPDDFSAATDELSRLQWIPLDTARHFDLPFITEVVLAEVAATLPHIGAPEAVPFFDNGAEESLFRRLGGRALA